MKSSGTISVSIAEKAGRPWWLWLHVLSLDAVLVALAGQEAFVHVAGVSLGAADRLLLGLCAWLAYCGDRLLDGRRLKTEAAMARHRFAQRHFKLLRLFWFLALLAAALLACRLSLSEWRFGLVLLAIVSAYFFLQHHRTTRKRAGRWKELMVGAGFAGGTLFFVVARAELSLGLICLGMAWAVACMQNCLVIAGWDRDEDVAMDQPSLARELSGLHYWILIGLLVQLALVGLAVWSDWAWLKLGVALLFSGALLGELERRGMYWPTEQRRVWADAVLLIPLLTLV